MDELVVVENLPGDLALPDAARLIRNERPAGYAANANLGIAATTAPFVLLANPDTVPAAARSASAASLRRGASTLRRRRPAARYPDGRWQPSRRRFPTVGGRSSGARRSACSRPLPAAARHYMLDEQPQEPVEADWMLGGFLLLRRSMLDELGGFDEGFRLYGEDIDLCYRAAKAGWERWYVPEAVVTHRYDAVTDRSFLTRRTLWHWRGIARFVRKHPERLRRLV